MSKRRSARRIGRAASLLLLTERRQYAALPCKRKSQEDSMPSTHVDVAAAEWTTAVPFYGPNAIYDGQEIVQMKILSDRRAEGGGIAWLVKFSPPSGKLIKIVATALSDEHVFSLEGGRVTKSGTPARSSGGYTLNPEGQPHSALIGAETVSLVVYRGEPDEIVSLEVMAGPTPTA
jgi:hypothetical protein